MVDFLYDFHLLAKIMLRGLDFSLYCVRLSASPKGVIYNDNDLPRTPGVAQCWKES